MTKEFDILPTCSVTNSKALSNIWLPYKEVTAIKRNRPSRTGVGISVRGMGNINSDNAMRMLERNPVSLVSLTLTTLQKKKTNFFKAQIALVNQGKVKYFNPTDKLPFNL